MKAVTIVATFTLRTLVVLLTVVSMSRVVAQDTRDVLRSRLRQLPPCVGKDYSITVGANESWTTVGVREHVGYEHFRRANPGGFKPGTLLIPGRHIVTDPVSKGIVINIPELTLFYFQNRQALRWYPVSVGMVEPRWHTVTGNYAVGVKEANPVWRRPPFAGGGTMPPGPNNPLGDRLINLSIPYYGLHGTNNPQTIGKLVSHGCIRMFPQHIRELFDLVDTGDALNITYVTVKIGQDDGVVYMAVYPDVYGKGTSDFTTVRNRLRDLGMAGVLSDQELRARLENANGIAYPILGSETPVTVNGVAWRGPVGPTIKDGNAYLPIAALAKFIGAEIKRESPENLKVKYAGKSAVFSVNGPESFRALDTTFVAIDSFARAFGGVVESSENAYAISLPPKHR